MSLEKGTPMKKNVLFTLALCLGLALGSMSFAEDESKTKEEGPCKKVMDACKAADFAKGDHTVKKGLFKDCMQPLLAGQTVAGVTIDAQVIAACKAIKDAKHKTK